MTPENKASAEKADEKKIALVTGGATGIGRACCRALSEAGFCVGVHYNSSAAPAEALVAELGDAFALQANLSEADGVESVYRALKERGGVEVTEVTPEAVGIARGTLAEIAGGDSQENARITRRILEGEHGPQRDVVLMNVAAALLAAGVVQDLAEGVVAARESIDAGKALAVLEALASTSVRLAQIARLPEADGEGDA